LKDVAHFLFDFWYSDPIREIKELTEKQLFWIPNPNSLCILWHVGHIAHREITHIGRFVQGLQGTIIPLQYEVFGTEWCSNEKIRHSIRTVKDVFNWVKDVRLKSHEYISSLKKEDYYAVPPNVPPPDEGLSVAHWIFITAAHTALHIGRIQMLRAIIENKHERAC
jgi:hypothetical protein